jgi:uncharacterized protein
MTNQHGDFIWYELLTSNADAAGDFYGKVVGWTSTNSDMPEMDYRFFSSSDGSDNKDGVGGYMAITPKMAEGGARPAWVGYIGVDDVDASVETITASGGAIYMQPQDVPNVGRMAMVADPQGAPFYVMKGASDDVSHSFAATEPKVGHCAWNELATSEPEAAIGFYASQFGWAKDGEMDMGPMGTYHMMAASGARFMIGGIMRKVPEDPQSHWLYYFRVDDIDAAAERITAHGGRIHIPAMEIPGGDYSLAAADPDGAYFGLVGPRLS